MIIGKRAYDAPVLTLVMAVLTVTAVPLVLYVLFTAWPDSLGRQVIAAVAVGCMMAFVALRQKYELLFLALIFLSQFTVSLHSFALAPPVLLGIFLSDIIIVLLVFVAFERRLKVRIDTMGWLFITWISWLIVASYFSAHRQQSLVFVAGQIKYFVLYVLALNMTLSESFRRRLEKAIIAVILMQAAIGMAQLLHGGGLGLGILGESFNTKKMGEYFVQGSLRIGGTIGATNAFAGYMAMLLVFLFPFVVTRKSPLFYLGFGTGTIALMLSLSRAGWLSFAVGSLCATVMMWRAHLLKLSRVMLFGLFGCLIMTGGAVFYADKITNRFENRQAIGSAQGRLDQFRLALPLIQKYPLVGIGPGVSVFFSRWSDSRFYVLRALSGLSMPNYIHSGQLQVWVESGTPGLVLFLAIVGVILRSAFGKIRSGNESDTSNLLRVGGISGALAIMIDVSFGTELASQHIFLAFWVLLGLAHNQRDDNERTPGAREIAVPVKFYERTK